MAPYILSESAFKAYLFPSEIRLLEMFRFANSSYEFGPSITNMSSAFVVTPLRIPQHSGNSAFTVDSMTGDQARSAPSSTVEGTLASDPQLSLSRMASATDGGVSLRGVDSAGGSGARVELDGVPFNEPFTGRVPWDESPFEGLARLEVVPGGGATAWGNGALGGVMQIFTQPVSGELVTKPGSLFGGGPPEPGLTKQVVAGTGEFAAEFGNLDTRSVEFVAAQPTSAGVLQVLGNVFSTDGFPIVSAAQRGPVDVAAWNRHDWLEARWRQLLGKKLVLTATVRAHEESHGDGTPLQQGNSEGRFASISVTGHPSTGFVWNAVAYVQDEGSASRFSSVNPARNMETPLIDQYAEPVTAFGASWSGEWWQPDGSSTSAGADLHHVSGETRQDFAFSDRAYADRLFAGGDQGDVGAFILRDQKLTSRLRLVLGARLDFWNEDGGHLSENGLLSGTPLGDERFPADDGTELSPSIGLVWRPSEGWRFHANIQQAFSTPTLAELYQPSGQYSVVTEANPLLRTERNTSVEAGAEYVFHLSPLAQESRSIHARSHHPYDGTLTIGATIFSNELHDAIGTVTLARDLGSLPFFGTLPNGYLGQEWINLDRSRIQGASLYARWDPAATFTIDANILFSDPTIDRVGSAPNLAGKQVAGVSRRSAQVGATWRVSQKITFKSRARMLGPEYEDDENTLRLAEAAVVDMRASYALSSRSELFVIAENLTGAQIETSRSVDGVVYIGAPRTVLGGIRLSW
jgi:outer membrane receptor protein involved in Fe transport